MMQHLEERQPRIVLQRGEKIFPAQKESLVSVLCFDAQETVLLLPCSLCLQSRKFIPFHLYFKFHKSLMASKAIGY
jgi:hypothetical protein